MKLPQLGLSLLRLILPEEQYELIHADLAHKFERDCTKGIFRARVSHAREVASIVVWRILRPSAFRSRGQVSGSTPGNIPLVADLRFGLRTLRSNPGFAAITITTLAIGIGATVTMFTAVNGILIAPLSYDRPDQLVLLKSVRPDRSHETVSQPDAIDIRAQSQTFEDLAIYRGIDVTVASSDGQPVRLPAAFVSNNYFGVLGVSPAAGRFFAEDEGTDRIDPVVVLSLRVWQTHFGSDEDIVGSEITVDGGRFSVIGVASRDFIDPVSHGRTSAPDTEAWFVMPMVSNNNRSWRGFWAVGRTKSDIALTTVNSELEAIARNLQAQYPASNSNYSFAGVRLKDRLVTSTRPALLLMLGSVGVVLLIACANVANLQLARAVNRESEIAVRVALGASRGTIVRQLLTESSTLALCGGVLGTLLAVGGVAGLKLIGGSGIPRPESITIGLPVLMFATGTSLITVLLFGLAPAVRASNPDLSASIKEGARASSGTTNARLRNALVVVQIALSVILLTSAGLLGKSLYRLGRVDLGFDKRNLMSFEIIPDYETHPDGSSSTALYERFMESIAAVPGVDAVGAASDVPLTGASNSVWIFRADLPRPEPGTEPIALTRAVIGDFFDATGIPLLAGRVFTVADDSLASSVIVINRTAGDQHFEGEDPIGKQLALMGRTFTVVGVVGDVRQSGPANNTEPTVYIPFDQTRANWLHRRDMIVSVRTASEPSQYVGPLRAAVAQVSPNTPTEAWTTASELYSALTWAERFRATLLGLFATIATVLATVGVAGVVGYTVNRRTRELGIRRALGAGTRDLVAWVVRYATSFALVGIAIGFVGSLAVGRVLQQFLFQTSPLDLGVTLSVPALLLLVVMIGSIVPARAASSVNPAITLREE